MVVTIPLRGIGQVPTEPLAGKVVLDTGNYYPQRDGRIPELDAEETTTSELLQRQLPGAKVVKAFNNIYFKHLASLPRPAGAADRTALPIAGGRRRGQGRRDRAAGHARVRRGRRGAAGGGVAVPAGHRRVRGAVRARAAGRRDLRGRPGLPAGADELRTALAAALRYRDME
ncbi:NADPH-dependent F420 reductase [Nonomuraea ferruginea]